MGNKNSKANNGENCQEIGVQCNLPAATSVDMGIGTDPLVDQEMMVLCQTDPTKFADVTLSRFRDVVATHHGELDPELEEAMQYTPEEREHVAGFKGIMESLSEETARSVQTRGVSDTIKLAFKMVYNEAKENWRWFAVGLAVVVATLGLAGFAAAPLRLSISVFFQGVCTMVARSGGWTTLLMLMISGAASVKKYANILNARFRAIKQ